MWKARPTAKPHAHKEGSDREVGPFAHSGSARDSLAIGGGEDAQPRSGRVGVPPCRRRVGEERTKGRVIVMGHGVTDGGLPRGAVHHASLYARLQCRVEMRGSRRDPQRTVRGRRVRVIVQDGSTIWTL